MVEHKTEDFPFANKKIHKMEHNKGTEDENRTLVRGTITHGVQFTSSKRQREPLIV